MYKNKNKNTRDKATQPAQATNAVSSPPCTNYEELDELQLERCIAGNGDSPRDLGALPLPVPGLNELLSDLLTVLPPESYLVPNDLLNEGLNNEVLQFGPYGPYITFTTTIFINISGNSAAPPNGNGLEVNSFMRRLNSF